MTLPPLKNIPRTPLVGTEYFVQCFKTNHNEGIHTSICFIGQGQFCIQYSFGFGDQTFPTPKGIKDLPG